MTAVTAAALLAMLVMGVLTAFAVSARQEAERQRGEAEGLVEFMLTDLRGKLKGVGRLDVMTAVNERALGYYAREDLSTLPANSLERWARVLHALGEDDEGRGNLDAASAKFRQAARATAALLNQAPNDPDRIFAHAQSEFWLGTIDFERKRFATAETEFLSYKALADRLIAIAPQKTKYRLEAEYAEGDLCTVAFKRAPKDVKGAIRHCGAALSQIREAALHPDKENSSESARKAITAELMNCLANMADVYSINGDLRDARAERDEVDKILDREMAKDPENKDLSDTRIANQIGLAKLDVAAGSYDAAQARTPRRSCVGERAGASRSREPALENPTGIHRAENRRDGKAAVGISSAQIAEKAPSQRFRTERENQYAAKSTGSRWRFLFLT